MAPSVWLRYTERMRSDSPVLLILDLVGTLAFALNGALTAIRVTRLDIVGVVTLGMITGIGGGIIRDILLGDLPPATFNDWRYLVVAASGGLVAYALSRWLDRLMTPILIFDAAGLSLFAVTGASKGLDLGLGVGQAIILGTITAVGGGTIRDVMVRQVPTVLHSELYAIPALVGATIVAGAHGFGLEGPSVAAAAAAACFAIRVVGLRLNLNAPGPPEMNR